SATTNTITFSTQPGNYLFTVANQVVSNVIYFPAPSSGSVVAGNTTSITFSPTTTKVSSASTTSSTSTSTSSTSSVSSTSTIIPANTIYYSLAFNSVPSAGIISFNGIGYQNGNAIQVAPGNYPINAIAPANFIFSNWASSNSMNLTLANPYSANTTLAVSGNGVVTASFNAITTFSESGLPASTIWSVIYGNYTLNAIAPNSITFSTPPGNYTFGVPNTMVANTIYVPVQSSGYLAAGNALSISFSLQQAVISSASINSTLSNITNFLSSNGIFAGSVFISNSSIIGATENRTTANIIAPIELSYQELSNLIPLNRQQLARAMRLVGNSMHVFSKNITAPYGMVMQNNRYINAGRELHYIAYNRHGIVTFYNVSIEKAIPRLAIKINGAAVSTPNSTSEVYVPIMPGQKSYKLSLSLESSLLSGNLANYSYKIIFSNDTAINGSINGNYVSYSKVFVLSSNESAKIIFDVSGNANYTAEDPSALVIPANIEYYVPITLSNSQAVATPVPFQDLLPVNSLAYSAYEAKNLDNIEFFYANGNVIPSWMEGSSSNTLLNNPTNSIYLYTSTNTLYWLNISSGIAASNSITIYMGFASTSQNLLNNIDDGEAPQLSSTWGLYDDGPHVFTQYGGGSWSSFTFVGGTWSTTNGYLQQTSTSGSYSGGPAALIESTTYPNTGNYVLGMAFNYTTQADARVGIIAVATPTSTPDVYAYRFIGQQYNNGAGFLSFLNDEVAWVVNNAYQGAVSTPYTMTITDAGGKWSGNLYSGYSETGTALTSLASTSYTAANYEGATSGYVGISAGYYTGSAVAANPINVMWFYMRAYPPNGVMPGYSFGSVTSAGTPLLSMQKNPVSYGNTDVITATATVSGDSVEILKNGNVIAGPAANTISYTICGTTPSLGSCWATGSYTITANDITNGLSSNSVLTVNKGVPALTLSRPGVVLSSGSINIDYGISTVGNQLVANLIANGAVVSSTSTNSIYSMLPNNGINSLEVTASGNGNYTAANVITEFCALPEPSAFPSNIIYYAPICVENSQGTATPAPFQQMINVTESNYYNYLTYNGNIANFEIFNAMGAVQPTWIESNSLGKLVTWVNIANGIAANSIAPLYIGFASNTFNMLSSSGTSGIGEAPQLSSTWGLYDDGPHVFTQYGGGSWSSFTFVGGTWSTTNGYLQQTSTSGSYSGGPAALIESTTYPNTGNYVLGMAFNYTTQADARVGIIAVATPTSTPDVYAYRFIGQQYNNGAGFLSFLNDEVAWVVNNAYQGAVSTPYTMTITDAGGKWSGNLYSGYSETGTALTSLASTSYTAANYEGATSGYVGISAGYYTGSAVAANPINVMWFYMRAYPPNGVMPSVFFGSAYPVQQTCTISLPTNAINFGSINPNSNTPTSNAITDDNTGNANAYMLVYGGNWIGPGANSFGVGNTLWAATSQSTYSGTPLSATPSNTAIVVPAGSSNSIYFGLGVPGGAPSGSYSQTITIENSC
ncbi:MAG: hypothetical protein QW759_01635, partial [Candidatus Micrarchaeaceae archaeon]